MRSDETTAARETAHPTRTAPLRTRLPDQIEADGQMLTLWRSDDESVLSALVSQNISHLRPFMKWAATEPIPAEERLALLERWDAEWLAGTGASYKVPDDRGDPCGVVSLFRSAGPQQIEIGYWVASRETGKGRITRAASALTVIAFDHPEIDTVVIAHDAANAASRAVAARLGYARRRAASRTPEASAETGVVVQWEAGRWWRPPAGVR